MSPRPRLGQDTARWKPGAGGGRRRPPRRWRAWSAPVPPRIGSSEGALRTMRGFTRLLIFVALVAAGGVGRSAAVASEGGAGLDPRLAGYPELLIRLTEERIEATPRVAAGRTLVIEENLTTEAPGHVFLARVPDDVTEDEVA